MATAVQTNPPAVAHAGRPSLVFASVLGAAVVFAGLAVATSILPQAWETAVTPALRPLGSILNTALLLAAQVAVVALFISALTAFAGRNPPHGLRGGIFLVMSAAIGIFFVVRAVGLNAEMGGIDQQTGRILMAITLGAALALTYRVLASKVGVDAMDSLEEQGWFHLFNYKPTQGLRMRRYTMVGFLLVGLSGVYSLVSHNMLRGDWLLRIPYAGEFAFWRVIADLGGVAPILLGAVVIWLAWRAVNVPPFADFLIATEAEMNKVSWSTRKRLVQDTIVVMATVLLMVLFFLVVDAFWGWGARQRTLDADDADRCPPAGGGGRLVVNPVPGTSAMADETEHHAPPKGADTPETTAPVEVVTPELPADHAPGDYSEVVAAPPLEGESLHRPHAGTVHSAEPTPDDHDDAVNNESPDAEDDADGEPTAALASHDLVEGEVVGDAPAEEPEPESKKKWYILKVTNGREDSVKAAIDRKIKIEGLEQYFGRVYVPVDKVTEIKKVRETKNGEKITKEKRVVKAHKKYPGYLMVEVEFNDEVLYLFRETSGVGEFVGSSKGKPPTPMLDIDVQRMLSDGTNDAEIGGAGGKKSKVVVKLNFEKGDKVRIRDGAFANMEGDVKEIIMPKEGGTETPKVNVVVQIFGRGVEMELDYWQVDKV